MCNGCGKVPMPGSGSPRVFSNKSAKETLAILQKERSFCPKCRKKMTVQPGNTMVCKDCGVTRR